MVIFNSYVSLPEGKPHTKPVPWPHLAAGRNILRCQHGSIGRGLIAIGFHLAAQPGKNWKPLGNLTWCKKKHYQSHRHVNHSDIIGGGSPCYPSWLPASKTDSENGPVPSSHPSHAWWSPCQTGRWPQKWSNMISAAKSWSLAAKMKIFGGLQNVII